MYESMKMKVESVVAKGKVSDEYISSEEESQILNQYRTKDFSKQNHPPIIQVLLNSKKDVDSCGEPMPNLVYISREKSKGSPHHFKAGALNSLVSIPFYSIPFLSHFHVTSHISLTFNLFHVEASSLGHHDQLTDHTNIGL